MQEENDLDEAFDEPTLSNDDNSINDGDNLDSDEPNEKMAQSNDDNSDEDKDEDEDEDSVWGDESNENDEIPERPFNDGED